MKDFVRMLFKASANGKDIPLLAWREAFGEGNSVPLELAATNGAGLSISFPSPEPNPWKQSDSVSKRSLIQLPNPWPATLSAIIPVVPNPHPIFFHTHHETTSDEHYVYFALARFGSRHDKDIRIRWNVVRCPDSGSGHWKSIQHFSTLSQVWVPNNGIELFHCLVIEVEKQLVSLCESNEADLNKSRSDILQAKGGNKNLAGRLLDQGMAWINLRSAVRDMASDAQKFAREYHKRHQETSSIEGLLGAIKNLSDNISKRISRLDEISKDLIQMEFNLISINEARTSTSMSRSMKRLSWITFIFLPLTFISGLFGMNVDILESNPSWWWYVPLLQSQGSQI
ncbi:cora-like Mg2+ transporter protein-domain-containing protein [Ilyonectria destructans]|nr:cora-like Mg2+ transporter protein-domain-containing protein [Ilyonectria destructans]